MSAQHTPGRDEPTSQEYRRKVAMCESALIEAREFVARLKVGTTPQRRDALLAIIDKALES